MDRLEFWKYPYESMINPFTTPLEGKKMVHEHDSPNTTQHKSDRFHGLIINRSALIGGDSNSIARIGT